MITSALEVELRAMEDLAAAGTVKTFWVAARRVLRAAVPSSTMWFAPEVECAELTSVLGGAPEAKREGLCCNHGQALAPFVSFLRAHPSQRVVSWSEIWSQAQLRRSLFFRELMAPAGEHFAVVLGFADGGAIRSLIALHRRLQDGDFTAHERQVLASIERQFETVLRRVWDAQQERATLRSLEMILGRVPMPIAVLDWLLKVVYHNEAALAASSIWHNPPPSVRSALHPTSLHLSSEILAGCAELKRLRAEANGSGLRAMRSHTLGVSHPRLPHVHALVTLLAPHRADEGRPLLLVAFKQPLNASFKGEEGTAERLSRLSAREREVASLVCQGESNKEVAAHLGKSVTTVKAQLQSIYEKLGTVSRGKLSSLLQDS